MTGCVTVDEVEVGKARQHPPYGDEPASEKLRMGLTDRPAKDQLPAQRAVVPVPYAVVIKSNREILKVSYDE
ncbi:hypothetical protein ACT0ZX_000206 [Yersinia enterocolitica]|nr:hypothetical protein [Yersinia enterocolitica]